MNPAPPSRSARLARTPAFVRTVLGAVLLPASLLGAAPRRLEPAPSPLDNPMKGLVPYAGMAAERFPHSLELPGFANATQDAHAPGWLSLGPF